MSIATLSIDIEARLAKLEYDLGRAVRMNKHAAGDIEARWSRMSDVAAGVGASLLAGFSVQAFAELTRKSIDALDALNDVSAATGSTVENLSALEDIARRNGGSLDEVSGILVKFNGALKEADGKNGVSMALEAIGLSAADLRKTDPAESLRNVSVALSGFSDDGNKARLVQDLFGKSVKDAAPFLRELAEQGALNATVTKQQEEEEAAAQADKE